MKLMDLLKTALRLMWFAKPRESILSQAVGNWFHIRAIVAFVIFVVIAFHGFVLAPVLEWVAWTLFGGEFWRIFPPMISANAWQKGVFLILFHAFLIVIRKAIDELADQWEDG